MTSNPARRARSPISQLFAAALDGDPRATRVLAALADEDSTATVEDVVEAEDALRALGRPVPDTLGEEQGAADDRETEELGRVWGTGYVDQLLARYRDETGPRARRCSEPPAAAPSDLRRWLD